MAGSVRPEDVVPRLRGRLGRPYRYERVTASTQRLLTADAPEGATAVADEQTEGRGRRGRRWDAAPETSLLVSVVLRPAARPDRLPELTVVTSQAVAEAIVAETGLPAATKFPNDVLVDGRKVAGILAEAIEGRVLLGIGINVSQRADELPAGARIAATSLELEAGRPVERAKLLVTLLACLERRYDEWSSRAT